MGGLLRDFPALLLLFGPFGNRVFADNFGTQVGVLLGERL
jgi:hypothetical protein